MKHNLRKIVLCALLTALSVVIDILFKMMFSNMAFGVSLYAIPLVIASIFCGPLLGGISAFIGDAVGVFIAGGGYLPLFALGSVLWGVIPGLFFIKKDVNFYPLLLVVLLTHTLVTLTNTLAIYVYMGKLSTLTTLVIRGICLPINSYIISKIVFVSSNKMEELIYKHDS